MMLPAPLASTEIPNQGKTLTMEDPVIIKEKLVEKQSEHYYDREGRAAYGSNITQARKQGHYPSATTILNAASSWTLQQWMKTNTANSAIDLILNLVSLEHHSEVKKRMSVKEERQALIAQIVKDADGVAKTAAQFGTKIHDGAESILNKQSWDQSNKTLELLNQWIDENIVETFWAEHNLVSPIGLYAGRADALVRHKDHGVCLLDFKTQKMQLKNGKYGARFYPNYIRQLAAYAACLRPAPRCLSVVINSVTPEYPVEKLYSEEEQRVGLQTFIALAEYWTLDKKYDPRSWVKPLAKEAA